MTGDWKNGSESFLSEAVYKKSCFILTQSQNMSPSVLYTVQQFTEGTLGLVKWLNGSSIDAGGLLFAQPELLFLCSHFT